MPYSKRIEKAETEVLFFTMLLKGCGEWSIGFDESKIGDDMLYVAEKMKHIEKAEDFETSAPDWLAPIKEKLKI